MEALAFGMLRNVPARTDAAAAAAAVTRASCHYMGFWFFGGVFACLCFFE